MLWLSHDTELHIYCTLHIWNCSAKEYTIIIFYITDCQHFYIKSQKLACAEMPIQSEKIL